MITREKQQLLDHYNAGLTAYKTRQWDEAIAQFELALRVAPDDGPSSLYLERSKKFKVAPPPDNWDGVYVMTSK